MSRTARYSFMGTRGGSGHAALPCISARIVSVPFLEMRGETGAAALAAALGGTAETARELCYRLYTLCERKKRAAEALSYNSLVQSWPEISRLARSAPVEQTALFDGEE